MKLFNNNSNQHKQYPYPVSSLLRYRISIIKFSLVYLISLFIFYLFVHLFFEPVNDSFNIIYPVTKILISGVMVSFYFIFLAVLIYQRIVAKVRNNLETEKIRELEQQIKDQKSEYLSIHNQLKERTLLLERQSEEIRQKNLELKMAQHEIREKANHLEVVSKYKSEFFANISHDLRTPLNSIIVLSQLIAENRGQNLTEKQKEFAKTIYSSGNVLLEFINEILDLTKIESGKIELRPENIPLWELTDQLNMMFQPVAQQKGLEFIVELEDNLPEVITSDSKRLQQILRNLISNAIKFTDTGSIRIHISKPKKEILPLKSGRDAIAINIIDTGIGIPEEKQSDVFEAFQQADGTTSSRFGGTGLGLTISRSLAVILGGEVRLFSQEGEGSTFTLLIPEKFPEDTDINKLVLFQPWKNQNEIPASFHQDGNFTTDDRDLIHKGDKRLLIVEDDASFANLLHDFATEAGFKTLIAANAECAMKLAKDYQPGVIVLDICLPGKSGWDLHKEFKNDPFTAQIPVFYISGAEETNEVTELGAIGYLSKPVSIDTLRETFMNFRNITTIPVIKVSNSEIEADSKETVLIEGKNTKIRHKMLD